MKQFIEVKVKDGDLIKLILINPNNITYLEEYTGNRCRIYVLDKKDAILTTLPYNEVKGLLE